MYFRLVFTAAALLVPVHIWDCYSMRARAVYKVWLWLAGNGYYRLYMELERGSFLKLPSRFTVIHEMVNVYRIKKRFNANLHIEYGLDMIPNSFEALG